jgi:replicative DNA helicase
MAVDNYLQVMDERSRGERLGLGWGMEELDQILLPARGGELILIAARPSIGKTVLGEQIASHWAALGPHPVIFASLEMPVDSLLDRTISRISKIGGRDVVRGILTDAQNLKVLGVLEDRRQVGLWYLDDSYATTSSIRAAAARVRMLAGGVSAIVVDYLGLLKDHHESEVTRVTRISRQLKAIAREFNVPLLALSQLNRASTAREDTHPRLQDLRDSGALEQDADRVLGLWRPDLGSAVAHLDVLKARQGTTGRIHLGFDGDHFQFVSPFAEESENQSPLDDDLEHFS